MIKVLQFSWPFCFAACLLASRIATLFFTENNVFPIPLLFSALVDLTIGFLLVILFRKRVFLLTVSTAFVLLSVSSYHYQAAFGALPGVQVVYYLSEAAELSPSVLSILLSISAQTFIIVTLLYLVSQSAGPIQQPRVLLVGILIALIPASYFQIKPIWLDGEKRLSATAPFIWLLRSGNTPETDSTSTIDDFLTLHGLNPARQNQQYPICLNQRSAERGSNTSPIVLINLESVSVADMNRIENGVSVMPNLQSIAAENLSFTRFVASGSKSIQSMLATFSGLPANPMLVPLHQLPLRTFDGFPNDLSKAGYDTAYFHGADLQFENQDRYLRAVGFDSLHSRHPDKPYPIRGWGYDDAIMFGELKDWLQKNEATQKFAALSTLSTHDPYILPPHWKPVFAEQVRTKAVSLFDASTPAAQLEAYHFSDHQLGEFYRWFTQTYANGLLIITADHPLQTDLDASPAPMGVPFILVGSQNGKRLTGQTDTRASHYDIGPTLLNLAGIGQPSCGLGLDLLSDSPAERVVYSIIGHNLERLQVYQESETLELDKFNNRLSVHTQEQTEHYFLNQLPAVFDELFGTLITNHHYLFTEDRYFPAQIKPSLRELNQSSSEPIVVSHRGNIAGANPATENSRTALQAAGASAFEWVEIDLQITQDNILILHHDSVVQIDGKTVLIETLPYEALTDINGFENLPTLQSVIDEFSPSINFLLEMKPPSNSVARQLDLAEAIVEIVRKNDLKERIIVDSFSRYMASFVKARCDCEVGFDAPFQESLSVKDLIDIRDMGMDWVYVHYNVYNAKLLEDAKSAGLKVMVYTVNDPLLIQKWHANGLFPDGLLTDEETILNEALRKPKPPKRGNT